MRRPLRPYWKRKLTVHVRTHSYHSSEWDKAGVEDNAELQLRMAEITRRCNKTRTVRRQSRRPPSFPDDPASRSDSRHQSLDD